MSQYLSSALVVLGLRGGFEDESCAILEDVLNDKNCWARCIGDG